ncbi:MAG: amino acid ABC transporter permease [Oscillospiraceae bacterium]|jgi:His/Glu/Gln/Arg/opine family amino acid ABC transporter permease subunit
MLEQIASIWEKYSYVYWRGLLGTLWLSAVTVLLATVLGTLLATLKLSKFKIFHILVNIYLEIIRGTPVLLQIYFFWLVLPRLTAINLTDTESILVALVVNASAYVCEIIRAGIQAVDLGQQEAGMSLGLTGTHTFFRIILPQAVKNILPALGNEFINMIKMTSLASVFFINELTTAYKTVQSTTFLAIPSLVISGLIYLVVTFVLTRCMALFEKRLKANDR